MQERKDKNDQKMKLQNRKAIKEVVRLGETVAGEENHEKKAAAQEGQYLWAESEPGADLGATRKRRVSWFTRHFQKLSDLQTV